MEKIFFLVGASWGKWLFSRFSCDIMQKTMKDGGILMSTPQNFRTAFNGFNREDVVRYLEYINNKHTTQVNQLTEENESLRAQLAEKENAENNPLLAVLHQQCQELTQQLSQAQERCAQLEQELARKPEPVEAAPEEPAREEPASVLSPSAAEELEAYRRAERIEREARERSELVYFQANSVLTEATAKVDGISGEITDMADQVMSQLTQLQMAISSSKQALQDAASIMSTIRPNQ